MNLKIFLFREHSCSKFEVSFKHLEQALGRKTFEKYLEGLSHEEIKIMLEKE